MVRLNYLLHFSCWNYDVIEAGDPHFSFFCACSKKYERLSLSSFHYKRMHIMLAIRPPNHCRFFSYTRLITFRNVSKRYFFCLFILNQMIICHIYDSNDIIEPEVPFIILLRLKEFYLFDPFLQVASHHIALKFWIDMWPVEKGAIVVLPHCFISINNFFIIACRFRKLLFNIILL